jgi:hypothetical protein
VFIYQSLLWFLPLVGVVLLIHLINMFRHRRVEWAALEFLLASYKRSRTRILMQQFLLMLLRMLAVAAVIFMLAQPKFSGFLSDLFGGKPTHHIVLLDDSFSMNDRNTAQGDGTIFDNAINIIKQITDNAEKNNNNDKLTIIRLSKTSAIEHGELPDVAELTLNADGLRIVRELAGNLRPSQSAAEPANLFAPAIKLVRQSSTRTKPVVYFISDFRNKNWQNPAEILKQINEIHTIGGTVRMIRSVDDERANLGITSIQLVDGIHAADVGMLVDVGLVNHGHEDVLNTHLSVFIDNTTQTGITIPRIKAGETLNPPLRFPVSFGGAGKHRVEVRLQPDAIADDNIRSLVVNIPAAIEILLIAPERRTGVFDPAQFVRIALAPTGIKSGIRTRTESPSFLASNPLKQFSAIFLLEAMPLELTALQALEEYTAQGGGVAIFLGADSNLDFVKSSLHKNGNGLFPFSPIAATQLDPDLLTNKPDINIVSKHPVFRLFSEGDNPLLAGVKIERYIAVNTQTKPAETNTPTDANNTTQQTTLIEPQVEILARLRNGHPLVAEKKFGKGKVISFLTSAAPVWNNWGKGNPSFVVVMLELAASLSNLQKETDLLLVGNPIPIEIDSSQFEPKIEIKIPPKEGEITESTAKIELITDNDGFAKGTFNETLNAGFYEVLLNSHTNQSETTNELYAVNVQADEGNTGLADLSELTTHIRAVNATLESAAGFSTSFDFASNRSWSDVFLYVLILFLMAETFLAGRIIPPSKPK